MTTRGNTMNTRNRIIATTTSILAVGAIVAAAWGASTAISATPEPTATEHAIIERSSVDFTDALDHSPAAERAAAARATQEAEAAAAAEAEAQRIAAEQEVARQAEQQRAGSQPEEQQIAPAAPQQPQPQEPAAPVLCPPGSGANASDGYNDTSCLPSICFTIALPDAAHPECEVAFRP